MPIFEYKCRKCGNIFEFFLRQKDVPKCPKCGSSDLTKLMSTFSSNVRKGSIGRSCNVCTGGTCSTCGPRQD